MAGEDRQMFIFVSELLGRRVAASDGKTLGRAVDLKVRLGELYPKAGTLVIRRRAERKPRALDWGHVAAIGPKAIMLRPGAEQALTDLEVGPEEILVR